jgi:hypothetical protein
MTSLSAYILNVKINNTRNNLMLDTGESISFTNYSSIEEGELLP